MVDRKVLRVTLQYTDINSLFERPEISPFSEDFSEYSTVPASASRSSSSASEQARSPTSASTSGPHRHGVSISRIRYAYGLPEMQLAKVVLAFWAATSYGPVPPTWSSRSLQSTTGTPCHVSSLRAAWIPPSFSSGIGRNGGAMRTGRRCSRITSSVTTARRSIPVSAPSSTWIRTRTRCSLMNGSSARSGRCVLPSLMGPARKSSPTTLAAR